jgi:hypothetical protein
MTNAEDTPRGSTFNRARTMLGIPNVFARDEV